MRVVNIGDCTLYNADCRDVLPLLEERVDLLLTDPPYGIGADKKCAQSSIRDNPKWEDKGWDSNRPSKDAFAALLHASKHQIIWGGNYFADLLPRSLGWLSWRKPQAETGFSLADIELAWTNLPIASRQKTLPRRDGNSHPTQKPVSLMEWSIGFAPKSNTVLDCYLGSGTTLVACAKLGRRGIGIELDPDYFEIACERVRKAYEQPDLFVAGPKAEEPIQEPLL